MTSSTSPLLSLRHCLYTAIRLPFPVTLCLGVHSHKPQYRRPHRISIHILDDDSLLHIFNHCRPVLLDEDENDELRIIQGGNWARARWWYKLAHVCHRWRRLVFASSMYLGLCLVSTHGTPVADMLAHSPPLPLIIDYLNEDRKATPEDEEGIMLALRHRDRVRCIRLRMPAANLQKLIAVLDGEFPILEFLYIGSPNKHQTTLVLPKTLQAPHLLHIGLETFAFPIQSSLLTAAAGLTTLSLHDILPSAYFSPSDLLQRLSLMPQLEILEISFHSPIVSRQIELPIMTHLVLPNLRWFGFKGDSAYLEGLLPGIAMPLLEQLQIVFFNQLSFMVPHLAEFLRATEDLHSCSAKFWFQRHAVIAATFPCEGAKRYTFQLCVICSPFDWQVAVATQIFKVLSPEFVAVEHLTFDYQERRPSLGWHDEVDSIQWRELIGSFSNVKTLLVGEGLIGELSRSLRLGSEESPLELLPQLKEVVCYAKGNVGDTFLPFVSMRQAAGFPVSLTVIPGPA